MPLLAFFFFASNFATEFLLGSEFLLINNLIQIMSLIYFFNILSSFFESINYSIGKNKYNVMGNIIRVIIILAFSGFAKTAFNTSLILLIASSIILIFMLIKTKNYYKIDFKSSFKILLFAIPLILFFAIDMSLILKIIGSAVSSIVYLFLIWKKVLDDVDRDLFRRFALKMKSVILKK
ncbi:MAG: hypothetical protein PHN56_01145 [Candidatus Nanoarchaeia archaeon]|nr:hypothetical protein [Candidatus Nanoarchaeia archaeon]